MDNHKPYTLYFVGMFIGLFAGHILPMEAIQVFAAWAGLGAIIRGGLWARSSWKMRKMDREAAEIAMAHKEQT